MSNTKGKPPCHVCDEMQEIFEAVKRVRDNCGMYSKDCPFCRFSGVCSLLGH